MTLVALDLGGVVVDVDHGAVERALGIDRATLERAFFGDGLHDSLTIGGVDGAEYARIVSERLGMSSAAVSAAWADVVRVTDDGRALVDALLTAGHAVHLWSNTDPIHLERMLGALPAGVRSHTASFVLGAMKPNADYYARARALGEPAVFLDDLDKNVTAARAAGIDARKALGAADARATLVGLGLL